YKYVEKPIRRKTSAKVTVALIVLLVFVGIIGYISHHSIIKPYVGYRFPNSEKVTEAFNDWEYPTSMMKKFFYHEARFYALGDTNDIVLFFGSSIAEQYAPRIQKLIELGETKKSAVFAT